MAQTAKAEAAPSKDTATAKSPERNEFRRFLMVDQAMAHRVASGELHMTMTEMRVWFALIAKADSGNYVRERQSWMADEFGIAKQHFSVALRGLIAKDMVCRCLDRGTGSQLMLSPFHFWKGKTEHHRRGQMIYNRLAGIAKKSATNKRVG